MNWATYFIVRRGCALFSEIFPSSSTSLATSRSRRCDGLGRFALKLILGRGVFLFWGECRFIGGSVPRPETRELHSVSWASSFFLMAIAWSAMRRVSSSSASFSSSKMRPRSCKFSDSARDSSPSSSRMRRARTLFILASSLFCRSIFLRTGEIG